jgi:geranylgeranyl diphosphate synthase type I
MSSFQHLQSFREEYTPLIVGELERFCDEQLIKAGEKDHVLEEMVRVLKEFILRGGKRVGPMMVILGYIMARTLANKSIEKEKIIRVACAVETHHLYLLNLDDMVDRDVMRHGGKTLEEYYRSEVFSHWPDSDHHGKSFSSIAGALLSSFTFELIKDSGLEPERILAAIHLITEHLFADTVLGWQIQYFQNNEPVEEASEERFMKGLEYVTSRYKFVGPLMIGLTLALDQHDEHFHQLKRLYREYGKHVGIAFQIQDDILGVFGDTKETGKAVGNDIREGKKTLLIQVAYRNGNVEQKKIIKSALNRPLSQTELTQVQSVMKDTGALNYSVNLAEKHVKQAVKVIDELPASVYGYIAKELAEYMIRREK